MCLVLNKYKFPLFRVHTLGKYSVSKGLLITYYGRAIVLWIKYKNLLWKKVYLVLKDILGVIKKYWKAQISYVKMQHKETPACGNLKSVFI